MHRQPDRYAVGLKPSATVGKARLRGLGEAAQAAFANSSRAVYGDGGPV